jgi:hypothetical protein
VYRQVEGSAARLSLMPSFAVEVHALAADEARTLDDDNKLDGT